MQFKVVICVVQLFLVTIHTVTGHCTFGDFQNYTGLDCNSENTIKFNVNNWTSQVIPSDFIFQTKFISSVDVREQHLQNISDKGFCGWSLTSIDAALNNITSLPANLLVDCTDLKSLSLSQNRIDKIDENAFQNLKRLSFLDLSHNYIEVFNGNFCKPLTSLNDLRLNNNKLKTITADMFQYILQLITLDVSNNTIANIREGSFLGMKQLTTLNVSFNQGLDFINLTEMSQLQVLNIEDVQLTQLNVTQNLVKIVANFNKISSISFEQPKSMLKEMYLRNNSLRDVKWMSTSRIENLIILDVANNNISDFYSLLFMKMKLQQFTMFGNPIDFDVAQHTKILETKLTSIRTKLNNLTNRVSDSRFVTNCTIIAFSLCVIFQILIFIYQNQMRWNVSFPNIFGRTPDSRSTYQLNQYDDYFPNLLD